MPPRLNLLGPSRSLVFRLRPSIAPRQPRVSPVVSRRAFADEKEKEPATGPNQDALGHVSEEAADLGRITGETTPDLGQGTPVQEILERDQEGREKAPQVIKKEMEDTAKAADAADTTSFANLLALGQLHNISNGGHASDPVDLGHKFGVPELPLPRDGNFKYRYDPVVSQVTTLLMRHGKLSAAQRNMSLILNQLRTAPPPTVNPLRPLLPGTAPASHLPLDPIGYLTAAIDSVAPLLRIRSLKGAAGGGAALQLPVPLGLRQRRRQAVQWILDAANKKESKGSGRGQFAQRVANEIISVVEGKSSVWDKRGLVHKTGTSARVNLTKKTYRRRM
ncbi:putative 30S ribosomal protein S7 [Drepanopeziza brunnea f. sp. 'multigermtubi' MB_m1]|uniref:Small ribosomal subunit protein uS7m n=1 Tax=Marssonina brunnea f. sp. multigermtubi (strain MB_m1) TaxID=1072389 RepID=K1WS82_MARBU|nr:putative 30S ribosomal protein S7 [Drepanopeziza brunnea f. sp. 'multigermtubi' MB_m1]EKD20490.1 putative 30S ribosomal protein S7 [Drepanopeziza brunnea f. sp. 'multigermtubi' MB_m1]